MDNYNLWSTDAVGRVSHWSPTQPDAGCGIWRGCPCVSAASELFFFSWIHADLAWFTLTRLRFASNRADSARIKPYQPNRVIWASDRNIPKLPKSALNHAKTAEISFEWGPNILNLSFFNFILNICYFFCVFFFVLYFVLCFLPSSFFVLWIKT